MEVQGGNFIKNQLQTSAAGIYNRNGESSPTGSVCGDLNVALGQKNNMITLPYSNPEYLLQDECEWIIKSTLPEVDAIITVELLDNPQREKYSLSLSLSGTKEITTSSNPSINTTELEIKNEDLDSSTSWIDLKGGFSQIVVKFSALPETGSLDAASFFKIKVYYKEVPDAGPTVVSVDYYSMLVKIVVAIVVGAGIMSLGLFACVIKSLVVEGRIRRRGALNRRWSDTIIIEQGDAPLVEVEEGEQESNTNSPAGSNSTRSSGSNQSAGSDPCILCNKDITVFGDSADFHTLTCGHVFHKECSDNWMRLLSERQMTRRCPECNQPHE